MNKLKKNPAELARIVKNHLVLGLVRSPDLADDLVGPSAALTKLRSNVYQSEDRDWKDVKVMDDLFFISSPMLIVFRL